MRRSLPCKFGKNKTTMLCCELDQVACRKLWMNTSTIQRLWSRTFPPTSQHHRCLWRTMFIQSRSVMVAACWSCSVTFILIYTLLKFVFLLFWLKHLFYLRIIPSGFQCCASRNNFWLYFLTYCRERVRERLQNVLYFEQRILQLKSLNTTQNVISLSYTKQKTVSRVG